MAALVTASENAVIAFTLCKVGGYLIFTKGTEQAEVVNAALKIFLFVTVKVLLKFKALGVLMVYSASCNG